MSSFMKIIQSILLGIVEGLTEFLPVSSTGHLIIVSNLIGFDKTYAFNEGFVNAYHYIIQLGAILAIVVLHRKQIVGSFRNFMPEKIGFYKSGLRFWLNIVIACIPGAVIEFAFGDLVEEKFFGFQSIAIALILGALVMAATEYFLKKDYLKKQVIDIGFLTAFMIGLFQCFAIFPGVSRSAATIVGGMICGMSLVSAAQFSFFLAIPVMFGMSGIKLVKLGFVNGLTAIDYLSLFVGFSVSFIVASLVVKLFLTILRKKALLPFVFYRVIFAAVIIIAGIFEVI